MLIETKLPVKYIFKQIKNDVARVLVVSIFFQLIKSFLSSYLPPLPLQLPAVLGSFISLILAFQVSQSYDRWWEARKIWGGIVNDSRTWAMQLKGFISDAYLLQQAPFPLLQVMTYRQIAWCYSLGQSLRGQNPIATLDQFLSQEELAYIKQHNNKPVALLALHTNDLKTLYEQKAINAYQQVQLSETLVRLCDSMGRAERINTTIFPVTYRQFVHYFIYLFLITLSLGLVETMGLFETPLLILIASTFFLLEKTARYLQDPFKDKPTDTPVTAIARTIEINLKQLLQEKEIPQPLAPEEFYLM